MNAFVPSYPLLTPSYPVRTFALRTFVPAPLGGTKFGYEDACLVAPSFVPGNGERIGHLFRLGSLTGNSSREFRRHSSGRHTMQRDDIDERSSFDSQRHIALFAEELRRNGTYGPTGNGPTRLLLRDSAVLRRCRRLLTRREMCRYWHRFMSPSAHAHA